MSAEYPHVALKMLKDAGYTVEEIIAMALLWIAQEIAAK